MFLSNYFSEGFNESNKAPMVVLARSLFLFTAVNCAAISLAAAQTSVELVQSGNMPLPTPTRPLEIADTDYPVESLIAHDEGQTALNVVVGADGAVSNVQIVTSSGSSLLDGTAARLARTRWSFQPSTGGATEISVRVSWKLPLSSANEFLIELPRPPDGANVVQPQSLGNEPFRPIASIRAGEQGPVVLSYRIRQDGNVDSIQVIESSGYRRLDEAGIRFVQRKKYTVGTVNGAPSDFWVAIMVTSVILGQAPQHLCFSRPFIGTGSVGPVSTDRTLPSGQWWLLLDGVRHATDALLLTKKGWMRVTQPIVATIPAPVIPADVRLVRKGPTAPCWIRFPGPS